MTRTATGVDCNKSGCSNSETTDVVPNGWQITMDFSSGGEGIVLNTERHLCPDHKFTNWKDALENGYADKYDCYASGCTETDGGYQIPIDWQRTVDKFVHAITSERTQAVRYLCNPHKFVDW